jgi:hypothetical protein
MNIYLEINTDACIAVGREDSSRSLVLDNAGKHPEEWRNTSPASRRSSSAVGSTGSELWVDVVTGEHYTRQTS